MRAKRSKRYRKTMATYQLPPFSFREPYQVLLDAAFLRQCHAFHMPLQKFVDNTLHGKCKLFITKCSLAKILRDHEQEIKRGGGRAGERVLQRPEFLPPPTEVPLRHCKHNEEGTAIAEVDCLIDILAGQPKGNEMLKNKQHFVLATADPSDVDRRKRAFVDVREAARNIPGVPIVYVKRSVMVLEELSRASERMRSGEERGKLKQGIVGDAGRKRKRDDQDGEEGEDEDGEAEIAAMRQRRMMQRAKGPNPLSMKKKKKKLVEPGQRHASHATTNGTQDTADSAPKAKRRRKHGTRKGDDAADGHTAASPALQDLFA